MVGNGAGNGYPKEGQGSQEICAQRTFVLWVRGGVLVQTKMCSKIQVWIWTEGKGEPGGVVGVVLKVAGKKK